MGARRLYGRAVERVWGRDTLPNWAGAAPTSSEPIGEVWFEDDVGPEAELLVKYLFTSQRLSIQVHPDNEAARALGFRRGKEEAWLVLDADPGAIIGLGLTRKVSRPALRQAAHDGSIEALVDWRPVRAGDFFYSPAGTVHAIGAGLSLVEIQQNLDLTYRLYDYGRPRELHLEQGIEASQPEPWRVPFEPKELEPGRAVLAAGQAFVAERWRFAGVRKIEAVDDQVLLIPLAATGAIDGEAIGVGSVWRISDTATLTSERPVDLLVAYPGAVVREKLCMALDV